MSSSTDRLSLGTVRKVPRAVRPRIDPAAVDIGIVHLGIGAFHRAHQAVFTEDAIASGGGDWGVCGVTQRSRRVVEQLAPQDGLYSVLTRSPEDVSVRVVGAVREVLFAAEASDALRNRLANPATRIVTLTVTEKGYHHDPATERLRAGDDDIAADISGRPPRTALGQLVHGLRARHAADAGPITVVCCDNLPRAGRMLAGLVEQYCARLPNRAGERLRAWIAKNVSFPDAMVDRIVPATTDEDRETVHAALGLDDHGVVVAEPFTQWVIEDDFPAGRPAWDAAGVILTDDVQPYERMKLRLLNASHSALAYLGGVAGFELIAQAVKEPALAEMVGRLMDEDVTPTLTAPEGVDLDAYKHEVVARFANPALPHRTAQVAMDGSQKLPQRLLGTARDRIDAGAEPRWVALAVAGWMRYVTAPASDDGPPLTPDDPFLDRIRARIGEASDSRRVAESLLSFREVFGDLGEHQSFRALVADHLERVSAKGALGAVREALKGSG